MTASRLIVIALALSLQPALLQPTAYGAPASASSRRHGLSERLVAIRDAIHSLQLEEAERMLAALDSTQTATPEARVEQARFRFFHGQYGEAVELMDGVLSGGHAANAGRWRALRDLFANTEEVTRSFERIRSPSGRHVVSFPPGKDAIMAPYALDVLQRADAALQEVFGVTLPSPIRLEIYPSPKTLAAVSPLTTEQIETTGTVALSKWNRLMITSPRALVRGYPWADTIGHELVHLVLSRVTSERAPVWLQEGTAKLFERAWRGPQAGLRVAPSALGLLYEAAQKDELLTFEEMHPSIAMLPSDRDAALAFAQVATFMDRYLKQHSRGALQDALRRVQQETAARQALAEAAGLAFARLESDWKRSLEGKPASASPRHLKRRFKTSGDAPDESTEVVETEARRFMRLGDLLWDRGRPGAAAKEYAKAHAADPEDPIVAARWGRAALEGGDPAAAERALAPQAELFPSHAPTHAVLGAARLRLGKRAEAAETLREAIRINPFDPQPHCDLARATDNSVEASREQQACEALE